MGKVAVELRARGVGVMLWVDEGWSSAAPSAASSCASSFASSSVNCPETGSSSTGRPPAGPGTGTRPSRNALAISEAFHLEYLILSRFCRESQRQHDLPSFKSRVRTSELISPNTERRSRKLAAARNFLAVSLLQQSAPRSLQPANRPLTSSPSPSDPHRPPA